MYTAVPTRHNFHCRLLLPSSADIHNYLRDGFMHIGWTANFKKIPSLSAYKCHVSGPRVVHCASSTQMTVGFRRSCTMSCPWNPPSRRWICLCRAPEAHVQTVVFCERRRYCAQCHCQCCVHVSRLRGLSECLLRHARFCECVCL
jgi:hypothetical protein